jgi:CSLREA domain-containing protein
MGREVAKANGRWGLLLGGLLVVLCAFIMTLVWPSPARAADFTVSKTDDTFDGACDSDCSLREAVEAANRSTGPDTIAMRDETYTLTLGPNESETTRNHLVREQQG